MKRLKQLCIAVGCSVSVVALSGCGPINMPEVSTYTISSLHTLQVPARTKSTKTLVVSMATAAPGFQTNQMRYETIPYKLRSFAKHAWVAPPSAMLLPLISQRIRSQGYFKAVVNSGHLAEADYRLDLQLLMLEQDFLQPTSQVKLALQATVTDLRRGRVLASERFNSTVDAPGNDPYSGVIATNQAAAQVTQSIAHFVVRKAN